jgi:hypothetical protein
MSACAQGSETGNMAAAPRPPEARSGPAAIQAVYGPVQAVHGPAQPVNGPAQPVNGPAQPVSGPARPQGPGGCRATVRDALDAALHGIRLGGRDRQFLRRLVHWDKRNAAAVATLLVRARQAGRSEAALSARQLEIVLTALEDAGLYRTSGAAAVGCWGCENIPGGRCADHARDADRARACAELAAQLAAGRAPGSAAAAAGGLPRPTDISGFRQRASVAS